MTRAIRLSFLTPAEQLEVAKSDAEAAAAIEAARPMCTRCQIKMDVRGNDYRCPRCTRSWAVGQ